jgi:2-polyprenyl-3-methyl-5-hydroxy-6-metoxy-1,4-benzoquinol methylase
MVKGEPDRGVNTADPQMVTYRVARIAHLLSGHWLDYGCAEGGYHAEMLERGLDAITGVDVEAPRIELAREQGLVGARYAAFDGHTLPFGNDTFDGVFMNEVIEHVGDERRALSEIHRTTRPGGVLALMAPNRWYPFEGHSIVVGSKVSDWPMPLVPWLPERLTRSITTARNYWPYQLTRLVRDAGFVIEEVGFVFPTFERYAKLPPPVDEWYGRNRRRLDSMPVLRRFGVSTLIVGRKPA